MEVIGMSELKKKLQKTSPHSPIVKMQEMIILMENFPSKISQT